MSRLVQQLQHLYVLLDDGDRRALRGADLTPTQYGVLRSLDAAPARELTVTRLAGVLLCTRGNATRLVQRLEEAGLVETRGDERDQRLVLVALTGEGESRLVRARALLEETDARRLDGLSAADRRALEDLTSTLVGVLAKDLDALDGRDA